jgi:hypothetical protein
MFLLLMVGIPMIAQLVSSQMRGRFVRFSQQPMQVSGAQAAQLMLEQHGIQDVQVLSVPGQLTDHYDPQKKTVNLSEVVFSQRNVAAVAVASHEVGHAVQHASGYPLLTMRSKMVPMLKISNLAVPVMAFGGAGVSELLGSRGVAILCLFGLGLPALFSFVTLPVEFDASRRALKWLEKVGLEGIEYQGARKALFWAAMTYVVAAFGSVVQALVVARMFFRRGR